MIKGTGLNKIYNFGTSYAFHAVKDLDIEIKNDEIFGIIGRSGAGKSTLLHILSCVDRFESGSLTIDDIDVGKLSDSGLSDIRNRKVGIVLQDFALIDTYTVLKNVMLPLYFSKDKKGDKAKRAMEALFKVGIADLAKKKANQLSGGQKQRVAIARAIVTNPAYIFADEPTGALDTHTMDDILNLLVGLNKKDGVGIIIITHEDRVAKICDRVIKIEDGRIIES